MDGFLHEKFGRDHAEVYQEVHEYVEKLKEVDISDWHWVKEITVKFCRERALIFAIKKAADMVRNNQVPDGGFSPMFDKAMRVGQELEPSKTLAELVDIPPDPTANLMGNRFLCRGGSLFLNGPTGVGKSSLIMQLAILAALGKPLFGIPIHRPLTALILQNENDLEDIMEEVRGVVNGLGLTEEELEKALSQIRMRTVDTIGDDFLAEFELLLRNEPADVVVIDPLLGFFSGGDIRTAKDAGKFVRQGILRLARQYRAALVCVNHTNKPASQKNQAVALTGSDLAYIGTGNAEIANAGRASLALQSEGRYDIFKLSLGKRGQRADFIDLQGKPGKSLLIRHSKLGICWELATEEDEAKLESDRDKTDVILNLIPTTGISIDAVLQAARKLAIGENRCRSMLRVLVENHQLRQEGGTGRKPSYYFRISDEDFK